MRIAIGLVLIAVAWPLNWSLDGLRTQLLFFPLWLGFVLAVDGLTLRRTGTSISARSWRRFLTHFALSVPVWWLFELMNLRLGNWEYVGREHFTDVEFALYCSLSFSTVMPAVLASAELMRSFRWIERFTGGPRIRPTARLRAGLFVAGLLMLASMLLWPTTFFPFAWTSVVLLLEPICGLLGRRSLLTDLERGDWRVWMSLWAGVLLCGVCWEAWNHWSYPKWIYHVPGVGFAKVFEMPLFGYLGYLPFSLELWLIRQLALGEDSWERLRRPQ